MDDDSDERSTQVRSALLKALAALAAVIVVVALGTTIMVRALGLDETDGSGPVGAAPSSDSTPLPTTALPVPGDKGDEPTDEPSEEATPDPGKKGDIDLQVSPVSARPMERVNLTGTYKGADNVQLEVQRFQDGDWSGFGVDASVRVGTYATYIMTGRSGENRFRMYDPQTRKGSNVVLVTID